MSPALTVSEAEMATGLRIFAESVGRRGRASAGRSSRSSAAAGAMHEVEAAG